MKDPATVAFVIAGSAAGASLGSVMGIPVEALASGLAGGLVALWVYPVQKPSRRVALYLAIGGSVFVSVITAGFLGPLTAAYIDAATVSDHLELKAASFVWGLGAQAGLLKSVVSAAQRRIDQAGGHS